MNGGPQVLATGGGAFMNEETRRNIAEQGISIWLRAGLALLIKRVGRRSHRPLLQTDNPEEVMQRLMAERHPVYETADLVIESRDGAARRDRRRHYRRARCFDAGAVTPIYGTEIAVGRASPVITSR